MLLRTSQDVYKRQAKDAVLNGAKEIWLLGQNVNDYKSENTDFPKLLKMVNDIPGKFWIRFTSPHPKDFSKRLINAMVSSHKYGPYVNLPLQSGSNSVLKRMNRPYTYEKYKKLFLEIKKQFKEKRKEDVFMSTCLLYTSVLHL